MDKEPCPNCKKLQERIDELELELKSSEFDYMGDDL